MAAPTPSGLGSGVLPRGRCILSGPKLARVKIPESETFQALSPFQQLVEIMAQLRAPGGCPWDRKQTHETLTPYLVEESHELIDAIESGDDEEIAEELGDVLLQVVFHAQLGRERGAFTVEDVAQKIVDKMVRRHPHVFGDEVIEESEGVKERWLQLKQEEKSRGVLDGVARSLPPMARARTVLKKVGLVGFRWPGAEAALSKVQEEVAEVGAVLNDRPRAEEELGDLLLAVCGLAHTLEVDPEKAMRGSLERFCTRFERVEAQVGGRWDQADLATAWEQAKKS